VCRCLKGPNGGFLEAKYLIFLCALGGAVLAAIIGALFGGLTGALTWLHGRAAGSMLGQTVADAFARVSDDEIPPLRRAILVGAVDGASFLSLLGAGAGGWLGYRLHFDPALLLPVIAVAVGFPLLAVGFGLAAYGLSWLGVRMIGIVCIISLVGALAGYRLGGTEGILVGTLIGSLSGMLVALCCRRA
jgi:hypothetical protein